MSLQLMQLQKAHHVKLPDGTPADSLSVHELHRRVKPLNLEINEHAGKQEILLALLAREDAEEMVSRRKPNPGEIIVSQKAAK